VVKLQMSGDSCELEMKEQKFESGRSPHLSFLLMAACWMPKFAFWDALKREGVVPKNMIGEDVAISQDYCLGPFCHTVLTL